MITEILLTYAAVKFFGWLMEYTGKLSQEWRTPELSDEYAAEFSDTDREKISATRNIIQESFGSDAVNSFRYASNIQRINMAGDFANRLAFEYGLNIDIDVVIDDVNRWGFYSPGERKAVFNIAAIASVNNDADFERAVRETIDTIIHELRHAVQHEAVDNPSFWNIGEERAVLWDNNFKNYIDAKIDMRGYALQPVERDASSFAAAAMKGVC